MKMINILSLGMTVISLSNACGRRACRSVVRWPTAVRAVAGRRRHTCGKTTVSARPISNPVTEHRMSGLLLMLVPWYMSMRPTVRAETPTITASASGGHGPPASQNCVKAPFSANPAGMMAAAARSADEGRRAERRTKPARTHKEEGIGAKLGLKVHGGVMQHDTRKGYARQQVRAASRQRLAGLPPAVPRYSGGARDTPSRSHAPREGSLS